MKRYKEFYYTNPQMVKDLIAITPIDLNDKVLDAGSGDGVWFNNLKTPQKFECEIERGCDFYEWDKKVDWVIGNPPFHESWKFFDMASRITQKGIALLINNLAFNSWTPRRYETMKERGFYLTRLHIVQDSRWFGRYYYLIFTKKRNNFVSWNTKTYKLQ